MGRKKAWTQDETEILRAHILAGSPPNCAHAELPGRSYFSVQAKYRWVECRMAENDGDILRPDEHAIQRDAAFQAAMTKAIDAGLERAPINTPQGSSDFRPKVFHPEPMTSGCSSALCDF